jgi:REP element-mobilizing transposase RayT
MSTKYKATTTDEAYFITITTVGWIDVFTRLNQKNNIINSLKHCQENKGLEIYAYCLMHSHLHLLCKSTNGFILSDVMRDFKKHTSKQIIKTIIEEPDPSLEERIGEAKSSRMDARLFPKSMRTSKKKSKI